MVRVNPLCRCCGASFPVLKWFENGEIVCIACAVWYWDSGRRRAPVAVPIYGRGHA